MTMLADMLERDRRRSGLTVGQAAWRVGVRQRDYLELEAGSRSPSFDTYDRICKLFGWPQTFVGAGAG
jgi:DNA-binding XRE family transcriptional regulator